MSIFDHPEFSDHEEVVFHFEPEVGLKAIIAVHSTLLGPSVGGLRMWPYADEEMALTDVLRLSRGMSYKSALAGLPFGGGKAVIIGDPKKDKSEALFRTMGRFVERLGGRYVVAEDVGITVEDVEIMGRETAHVAGTKSKGLGDPSPATARGVYYGMLAALRRRLGKESLKGCRVAVQGVGHVGYHLCRILAAEGAELMVTDINEQALSRVAQEFGADIVAPDKIYNAQADFFAPCALGAILNDETIPRLQVSIVAGSANNQLAEERHGAMLKERDILYAPDYAINAGGIIAVDQESRSRDRNVLAKRLAGIGETLEQIFDLAQERDIATSDAADLLAQWRLDTGSKKDSAAA